MTHLGELLSAYLDGEVTESERNLVTSHIGDCATCQTELADLHLARSALRSLPVLDLPAGLLNGGDVDVVIPLVRRPRVWMAAAAATVAVFVGVATFVTPEPTVPITFNEISLEHNNRSQLDPLLTPGKAVPAVSLPIGGAE
ncbi:MAG: zf-HC2 domain-containing protein [Acidimicrobiia bacterium]|nr:zf-HC2 domain-containing protein [Acidimicrobiia bacterium]